jgi:hypothetical protein
MIAALLAPIPLAFQNWLALVGIIALALAIYVAALLVSDWFRS